MAFCSLYGPISSLSMVLCSFNRPLYLNGFLSLLQSTVLSTALCLLYSHLYPLNLYVPTTGHVPLYDTLYPLWSYVPFKAICPLYGPMSSLRPSATSTALCSLNCPLSPLQLLLLYDPLSHLRPLAKKAGNDQSCFAKCFAKHVSSKLQGLSRSISY
jgi:hypothetical protein